MASSNNSNLSSNNSVPLLNKSLQVNDNKPTKIVDNEVAALPLEKSCAPELRRPEHEWTASGLPLGHSSVVGEPMGRAQWNSSLFACLGRNDEFCSSDVEVRVSDRYVFKSRLHEYAQKKGFPTPVYETIKEGPSHEPSFRSTVIVKDLRYDSLPGFFNRKAAEQSAAEVALMELAKSDPLNECISQPVHETGLCKNLLQEYAQKMNFAIPVYLCQKNETPGRGALFNSTVEIGGIQYIGGSAKTKKEAEIKAARTALLAVRSSASESSNKQLANHQLTVIPFKKRTAETTTVQQEVAHVPKAKKARFKKKMSKKKILRDKVVYHKGERTNNVDVTRDVQLGLETNQIDASFAQGTGHYLLPILDINDRQDGGLVSESSGRETADVPSALMRHIAGVLDISESMPTVISSEFTMDAPRQLELT